MRIRLFLVLLLFLTLSTISLAQQKAGYIEFADGERMELDIEASDSLDTAFGALLDGPRDGKMVLTEDGKPVYTFVRKGQQVTASAPGQPDETMSIEQVKSSLAEAKAQGMLSACMSNLKNTGTALEMWAVDHEGVYPESLTVLAPEYLKVLLTCPAASKDTYSATYKTAKEPVFYRLNCSGDHSAAGVAPGYPAYNGEQGIIETPDQETSHQP